MRRPYRAMQGSPKAGIYAPRNRITVDVEPAPPPTRLCQRSRLAGPSSSSISQTSSISSSATRAWWASKGHDRLAHAGGREEAATHAVALVEVDRDVHELVREGQKRHHAVKQLPRVVAATGAVQPVDVHEGSVDGRGGHKVRAAVEGFDQLRQRPAAADGEPVVGRVDQLGGLGARGHRLQLEAAKVFPTRPIAVAASRGPCRSRPNAGPGS